MGLVPAWARPVAVLGLEMQLAELEHKAGLIDDQEFCRRIGKFSAALAMLPER